MIPSPRTGTAHSKIMLTLTLLSRVPDENVDDFKSDQPPATNNEDRTYYYTGGYHPSRGKVSQVVCQVA